MGWALIVFCLLYEDVFWYSNCVYRLYCQKVCLCGVDGLWLMWPFVTWQLCCHSVCLLAWMASGLTNLDFLLVFCVRFTLWIEDVWVDRSYVLKLENFRSILNESFIYHPHECFCKRSHWFARTHTRTHVKSFESLIYMGVAKLGHRKFATKWFVIVPIWEMPKALLVSVISKYSMNRFLLSRPEHLKKYFPYRLE